MSPRDDSRDSRTLYEFVRRLTGLDEDRVRAARERVAGYGVTHLSRELVEPLSIDAAVACVLLVDSIDALLARGVEETKLMAKLRSDPDVWPTWAELRAAEQVARHLHADAELRLEAGRAAGAHADFWVRRAGGEIFEGIPPARSDELSIEFKALGLSEEEARFCAHARPTLDALRPSAGFVTIHAPLEIEREGVWLDDKDRRHGERAAVKLSLQLPSHTIGLSGAVVAAQGAEKAYIQRLTDRFVAAFRQLPDDHDCWVAFHWSNGTPLRTISDLVVELELPENVAGVALIGSAVAFPDPQIHNFFAWARVPDAEGEGETQLAAESGSESDDVAYVSSVDENFAKLVFERVERSSGVRASVVRGTATGRGQPMDLLVRDGSRRILPFVLLIDPDPRSDTHANLPDWMPSR